MSVGIRIKKRRIQLKMSAARLGELIGKDRATVYRYESQEIENMPLDLLPTLADALRVSPSYLMGWDEKEVDELSTEYDFYPGPVAAGILSTIEGVSASGIKKINVPDSIMGKYAGQNDIFLMHVNGDSMNKVIPHESMIAVKKVNLDALNNDDIVVFSNDHDYGVKRYYNDVENERLIFSSESTNRKFADQSFSYAETENLVIHGKVIIYIVAP